jgi:tetratricopeptide (TPR) repeat protein
MVRKIGAFFLVLFSLSIFALFQKMYLWPYSSSQKKAEDRPEVISLLGKKLYAAPAEGDALLKLQSELKEAKKNLDADPHNPELIAWYGRRLAYLWRYHEAIVVYTKGIEEYPDYAMLYRHRGHRYISIRDFDKAIADLEKAAELNNKNFDIWYHLGLAFYLKGNFEKALYPYQECLKCAEDDDSKIAISNWLCIALHRLGKKDKADEILQGITEGMKVVENQAYYNLLFFYKGIKKEEELSRLAEASDLDMSTIGYGIGCWYLYNGSEQKAKNYFEKIVEGKYWPAFGFIAAEAELAHWRK